jgi:hypothetical protein
VERAPFVVSDTTSAPADLRHIGLTRKERLYAVLLTAVHASVNRGGLGRERRCLREQHETLNGIV